MDLQLSYRYSKAKSCVQIMSYDDLMRMYNVMIHVNSWREAYKLWGIVFKNVNNKTFDSFSELNEVILTSIQEFATRPTTPPQPSLLGKRQREDPVQPLQRNLRAWNPFIPCEQS